MVVHRRWNIQQQQRALLEYSNMAKHCPSGVFVTSHPSTPCSWRGVYIVRRGSYATAPLRFSITFPPDYPAVAPKVEFTNDLFHPLVCPLTTYTYSTASPARQPVSSADDQRLSAGSLNLQHGFPMWFGSNDKRKADSSVPGSPQSTHGLGPNDLGFSDDEFNQTPPAKKAQGGGPAFMFMPPPQADALTWTAGKPYPSIAEVLQYMVRAFEDEEFLDEVPLDAAANSSAHHAWAAYRKRVKEAEVAKEAKSRAAQSASATPQHRFARSQGISASPGRSPAAWNWDGVWQERVRNSVKSATADGKLYKEIEGDPHQLITFLDREKEELMLMKADALQAAKVG